MNSIKKIFVVNRIRISNEKYYIYLHLNSNLWKSQKKNFKKYTKNIQNKTNSEKSIIKTIDILAQNEWEKY